MFNGSLGCCYIGYKLFYQNLITHPFQASPKFRYLKRDLYRITGYEIIIIDCLKMPSNINKIRKHVERFIVPD